MSEYVRIISTTKSENTINVCKKLQKIINKLTEKNINIDSQVIVHDVNNVKEHQKHATINIYVYNFPKAEYNRILYPSNYIFYLPDIQKIGKMDLFMLRHVDLIICESIYIQKIMAFLKNRYEHSYITIFFNHFVHKSKKIKMTDVKVDNDLFVHMAGPNSFKNTGQLIKIWASNDFFMQHNKNIKLFISRYKKNKHDNLNDLSFFFSFKPQKIKSFMGKSIECYKHKNIYVCTNRLDYKIYSYIFEKSKVSICPSMIETNMKYIIDSIYYNSYVVSIDLEPMNEILSDKYAELIKSSKSTTLYTDDKPYVFSFKKLSIHQNSVSDDELTNALINGIKKTSENIKPILKRNKDRLEDNNKMFTHLLKKNIMLFCKIYDKNKPLYKQNVVELYDRVYLNKFWALNLDKDNYNLSGLQSTNVLTLEFKKRISDIFDKMKIKSVVDAGCGHYQWFNYIVEKNNVKYVGYDISKNIININEKKYPNIKFQTKDIRKDNIENADIVFCRFVLNKMSLRNILKTIVNINKSKCKYVGLTNILHDKTINNNVIDNIELVLEKRNFDEMPFFLSEPIHKIKDVSFDYPAYKTFFGKTYLNIYKLPLKINIKYFKENSIDNQKENIFNTIYKTQYWKRAKDSTLSGDGSTLSVTVITRNIIKKIIDLYNIKSIYDCACGDMNWMPEILKQYPDIKYIGGDVASYIIQINKKRQDLQKYKFIKADFTEDKIPVVDLVICRDVLQHLNVVNVIRGLKNISTSGCKYFLATNYINQSKDLSKYDIMIGDTNERNLNNDPINLPQPIVTFDEKNKGKHLSLWKLPFENWNK